MGTHHKDGTPEINARNCHYTGAIMILDDILDEIENMPEIRVRDVAIGRSWTAVWSSSCGIASNNGFIRDFEIPEMTHELLELSRSWDPFYSSLGIATVNSVIEGGGKRCNAFDILMEECRNRKIAMVGEFPRRYTDRIRTVSDEFYILEINPFKVNPKRGVFPETAAEQIIPRVDVLAVTGSTLVNHSTERYLALAELDAFVAIIGPTTPMTDVFFEYGVDMIAGVEITDPVNILKKIRFNEGMLHEKMEE